MTRGLVAGFVAATVLFLAVPGVDLGVSRLFYDGTGFPLSDWAALEAFRNVIWAGSIVTALAGLALWLLWLPLGRRASVPGRLWGWIAAVYVVGPGLLVNALLKEHWGRARPARVLPGEAEFTRPFVLADQCEGNCSFVSGEASAAAVLAFVLGALVWRGLTPRGRRGAAAGLGAMAALAGLMRIATGRHFLSDVVLAWFLMAFVALALWRLMRVGPARDALSLANLRADLRALGGGAARRWRRLVG